MPALTSRTPLSVVLAGVLILVGCEAPEEVPTDPRPGPGGLTVELSDVSVLSAERPGQAEVRATIRFRNLGADPIWLLKPLDGSTDGRLMPSYSLTVTGQDQEPLHRAGMMCIHCGTWHGTEWPRDYLVEVPPGKTHETKLGHRYREVAAGWYTVRFKYEYLPRVPQSPTALWCDLEPPAQAWRGSVEAPEVVIEFRPTPVPVPPEVVVPPADPQDPVKDR